MIAPGRLAVVVPAYNAGRHLGDVLQRISVQAPPADVWVVDDGSTDDTAKVAMAAGVQLLRQWPNQGKGAALRRGFAETARYEWVVTVDADGQHDPADLPRFWSATPSADLIVGARELGGRMPPHRRIGNVLSSWLTGVLAGQPVPDSQSGYRLHRRAMLDAVLPTIPTGVGGYVLETEMLVRAGRQGFRLTHVPIATVYADEQSHFRPLEQMPRFFGVYSRLSLAVLSGRAGRRAAVARDLR
jgi:glycosyltransferase involved in cell wall biosynthesis